MGPKSKAAVIKVLGALTDEARSVDVRLASIESKLDTAIHLLTSSASAVDENTRMVGETIASHTKANSEITSIRRDLTQLEREVRGEAAE